jgi:alpha-maltose-1-phosphate synthase
MPELAPAVLALPEAYEVPPENLLGRVVGNREFLRGLIRYGGLATLHAYTPRAELGAAFEKLARGLGADMPIRIIDAHRLYQLADVGGLAISDPNLIGFARQRSLVGPQAYALTGVTHTLGDFPPMAMVADLATAPVQPWDALVCSSRAAVAMVEEMLQAEHARLVERLGATRFPRPLLPVIPFGIDPARFERREEWRSTWRERLGIGAQDVAVLYVGRLSRHGKAHPLPMMAALGRAARTQPQSLHLILAGRWLHPPEEAIWREQAAMLCPEVQLHVLDGRDDAVPREIWSAADIFTLLVDNIQETFGLAPVEAMAAGLPVVVTDWDGFRDTVRHGLDGMLVPTVMAPPGEGREASLRYATSNIYYGAWLSLTARLTAVDISAAAEAFRALAADPMLRRRMGAAGQARVKENFDWAVVIPQYQALWQEQQAIRLAASATVVPLPDPLCIGPEPSFCQLADRRLRCFAAAAAGCDGGHDRPPLPAALYGPLPARGAGRGWDNRASLRAAPPRRGNGAGASGGTGARET